MKVRKRKKHNRGHKKLEDNRRHIKTESDISDDEMSTAQIHFTFQGVESSSPCRTQMPVKRGNNFSVTLKNMRDECVSSICTMA